MGKVRTKVRTSPPISRAFAEVNYEQKGARPAGPVCPPNWWVRFDKARELAGLAGDAWPENGLRHSFASYHAAHFQDAGKLASEMGHTTPGIVFQHYRELVEPEKAARYWSIRPTAEAANVVPMQAKT